MAAKRHSPLVICLRCHAHPEFILDTVDSIFHYSTSSPHVMLAIDRSTYNDAGNQKPIIDLVKAHYPQVGIYPSDQQWGWGAGMYGLLCDALKWAKKTYLFDHFLSLDYDALFVGDGPDQKIIDDCERPKIGLVGTKTPIGKTWEKMFTSRWGEIMTMTDGLAPGLDWAKSCVYGAVMCISKRCLDKMDKLGYFDNPFRNTKNSLKISDDPWLVFLVKLAGFDIRNNRGYCYNVWKTPEPYQKVMKEKPGTLIFHPIKMGPGGRPTNTFLERTVRNWFRQRRNRKPLEVK